MRDEVLAMVPRSALILGGDLYAENAAGDLRHTVDTWYMTDRELVGADACNLSLERSVQWLNRVAGRGNGARTWFVLVLRYVP